MLHVILVETMRSSMDSTRNQTAVEARSLNSSREAATNNRCSSTRTPFSGVATLRRSGVEAKPHRNCSIHTNLEQPWHIQGTTSA